MRPGYTEITYPKNKYQFFTYIYNGRIAMVWVDRGAIISKGFSNLPEWEIHKRVRRSAKKNKAILIDGHKIQSLKLRLYGSSKEL